MRITVLITYNSLYDSTYDSVYDSPHVMAVVGHDVLSHTIHYTILNTIPITILSTIPITILCIYLYVESPPVKLVLITEEGILRQISQMRENKPWTDTSLVLETAQVKKGTKGRKGQRRGRPGKKKAPSTSTAKEFDPGKQR